nr:immunoglobulin heavy chain junction region [Mus musculus]MBK4189244.1 immunoglobulin heavy chain junction region [Mus musculus]MBK4189245.1 immunoglobulin heavy chain junction region [Mus musculus]
CARGGWDVAYW